MKISRTWMGTALATVLMTSLAGVAQSEDCAANPDWPNLAAYRDHNELLGSPHKGELRVVFMGDSITEFWDKTSPDIFRNRAFVNRGISGQTTPQMLIRFKPDVIDLKPAVVVILAGTNDVAGNTGPASVEMIENNIASMADLARAHGIKVVLSSVIPANKFYWAPELEPATKIAALNKRIKEYAARNGMVYVDYYAAMVDEQMGLKREYSEDGVHPNESGYKVMNDLVLKGIAKAGVSATASR